MPFSYPPASPARRPVRIQTVFHNALRKTFHTLLFDYLPDFLASQTENLWRDLPDTGRSFDEGQGGQDGDSPRVGGGGVSNGSIGDTPWPSSMLHEVCVVRERDSVPLCFTAGRRLVDTYRR